MCYLELNNIRSCITLSEHAIIVFLDRVNYFTPLALSCIKLLYPALVLEHQSHTGFGASPLSGDCSFLNQPHSCFTLRVMAVLIVELRLQSRAGGLSLYPILKICTL